jgi:MinD-like ATPase involved in chromosome partitioning or flagellar assembly
MTGNDVVVPIEILTYSHEEGTVNGHAVTRGRYPTIHDACIALTVPYAQQAGAPILTHAVDTIGAPSEYWLHVHPDGQATPATAGSYPSPVPSPRDHASSGDVSIAPAPPEPGSASPTTFSPELSPLPVLAPLPAVAPFPAMPPLPVTPVDQSDPFDLPVARSTTAPDPAGPGDPPDLGLNDDPHGLAVTQTFDRIAPEQAAGGIVDVGQTAGGGAAVGDSAVGDVAVGHVAVGHVAVGHVAVDEAADAPRPPAPSTPTTQAEQPARINVPLVEGNAGSSNGAATENWAPPLTRAARRHAADTETETEQPASTAGPAADAQRRHAPPVIPVPNPAHPAEMAAPPGTTPPAVIPTPALLTHPSPPGPAPSEPSFPLLPATGTSSWPLPAAPAPPLSAPHLCAPAVSAPAPSVPALSAPAPLSPPKTTTAGAPWTAFADPGGETSHPSPTLDDLLATRPTPPDGPAQLGWRAAVRRLSGGLITLRPGGGEVVQRKAIAAVQRSLPGPRTVVVINPKGGASKTTATLLLAATFGIHRGGYTLAWDNNETRGTMGWRATQGRHSNTAVDLLRELDRFEDARSARVGDLDNFVRSQGNAQFDVLASDEDAASAASVDATAFNALHRSLSRFYRVIVVDTGNNMRASNWDAAIAAADQVVIVSTIREDTGQSAAWVADALSEKGFGDKVSAAVTILAAPSTRPDPALAARLGDHFGRLTRGVVRVPFDPSLVSGGPIDIEALSSSSRDAWLEATALVADGL